jgi:uncharacterized protein YrrD
MNNASLVIGKAIEAADGEIGSVDDLYFDDQSWSVRYLVVDTGKWLPGRRVVLTPEAIVKPWHHQAAVAVKLTKEQIQSEPDADTAKLRSANELADYHVKARDGEVGHVQDLLLDDDLARVLFLVVEVKSWLFGKKVLVGPSMITNVDQETSTVHLNANRQALKSAQEYDPAA